MKNNKALLLLAIDDILKLYGRRRLIFGPYLQHV